MFESLTQRLNQTLKNLKGQGRLSEDNIKEALRDVRRALLEADVALPVIKAFIARVQERSLGQEVVQSLSPGQQMIKIVRQELEVTLGVQNEALNLAQQPPAIILMAGLQGAGKTTSVAKLARFLKEKSRKKVLVVSGDVYRPAAIQQLQVLAQQVGVDFFPSDLAQKPLQIAQAALKEAKLKFYDVLLVDTAGRLAIDAQMMDELVSLHAALKPVETLFVVDAMTGQDAANTAKAFHEALPITGVVLTKTDGDSRGGAALSIREITGKPIKFLGVGEKTTALEPFYPDRLAQRILGMGDVLGLIEELEAKVDKDKAAKLAQKLQKTGKFDLADFLEQMSQMRSMGGLAGLMDKLPGMGSIPDAVKNQVNDKTFAHMEAIVLSMTPKERANPDLLNGSRKRRIAAGSGRSVPEVNRLLKQFKDMQKMMKQFKGGKMTKMLRHMPGMGGLAGLMPPR
jgi:signal recognition particle subunit SRP54